MTVTTGKAIHALSLQTELGEGPVWDASRSCLWCVDILAPAVHRLDPVTRDRSSWTAPAKMGWVLPTKQDHLVAGLADGLYSFTPSDGAFRLIAAVEPDRPGNLLNDATLGADGTIWFGTMDRSERIASGRFYRFDGTVSDCGIAPTTITNGPAPSPEGATLYAVDTLAGEIRAYPVGVGGALGEGDFCPDRSGRRLSRRHLLRRRRRTLGGALGRLVRPPLRCGWRALTDVTRFPVANVTKVALGGPEGRTAYATTARKGLDSAALAAQPVAGDIFCFTVRVGAPPRSAFA